MKALIEPILESTIQDVWGKATAVLPRAEVDQQHLVELIDSLRHCATQAQSIGFDTGSRELLRMAGYLEGRISPDLYQRYRADGFVNA
jgi:hypothetical protein